MIECMIIGDSIAVGSHMFRKECISHSKGGISSHGWDKVYGQINLTAKTVIISLGTNDWEKANTYDKLKEIRSKIKAQQVFWIAPNVQMKPKAFNDVFQVSNEFRDILISTNKYQVDRIHPSWSGYEELMRQTK